MFAAEYYQSFYYFIVTFLTILVLSRFKLYAVTSKLHVDNNKNWGALVLTILMILFIGFRPISDVFADMPGYANAMLDHRYEYYETTWYNNFIFQPMMAFLSSHGAPIQMPIVILAVINFGATFFAMKKMFPHAVLIAMLVFLGAFSTFSYATNGLKAGCAMAWFFLALAYWDNLKYCIIFLVLSLGFHHAMQLPLMAFLICRIYCNTKVYLLFWLVCFLLAVLHITSFMGFFGDLTDDHSAEYLYTLSDSKDTNFLGKKGFRFDFVLYSMIPIVFGGYLTTKKKVLSKDYTLILNIYILINSIWMLCMYASYTNRIAYLSWGFYPVLLVYPFLKREWNGLHQKHFLLVVMGHLLFTLIMYFMVYN